MGSIVKGIQSLVIALGLIAVAGTGAVLYFNNVNPSSGPSADQAMVAEAPPDDNGGGEEAVPPSDEDDDKDSDELLSEDERGSDDEDMNSEGSDSEDLDSGDLDSEDPDSEDSSSDEGLTVSVPSNEKGSVPSSYPHEHEYTMFISKVATCVELGEFTWKCDICGDTYTEDIPMTDHKAGDWITERSATTSETGFSRTYCQMCGRVMEEKTEPMLEEPAPKAPSHQHTYETYISKEPTCTTPGERMYACVDGDSFLTSRIPPTNHASKKTRKVDGDCGHPGYEQTICGACNAILSETEITYDHKWTEWNNSIFPNSVGGGTRERVCKKCGKVETKALPTTNIPSP